MLFSLEFSITLSRHYHRFSKSCGYVDGTCTAHISTAKRLLLLRARKSQRKIDATCLSFIAGFHQYGTDQTETSCFVGEDADHPCTPFDLPVEPFHAIGGAD